MSAGAFDSDRMLLNCTNGLVDLRTGELLERGPEHLVSKLVEVDYEPTAKCPTFNRLIDDIFCRDRDLIRWVQRALGCAITGSIDKQLLFIAYGTGANGKSTLFELLNKLLVDYSRATDFKLFLGNQKSDVRMMKAVDELKGTSLALASESDGSSRFNETVLKRLTGGDTLGVPSSSRLPLSLNQSSRFGCWRTTFSCRKRLTWFLASDQNCSSLSPFRDERNRNNTSTSARN